MNGSRPRTGREVQVYDGTIQTLYGVGLQLQYCMQVLDESPDEVKSHLDVALGRLNDVIETIRGRIYDIK